MSNLIKRYEVKTVRLDIKLKSVLKDKQPKSLRVEIATNLPTHWLDLVDSTTSDSDCLLP